MGALLFLVGAVGLGLLFSADLEIVEWALSAVACVATMSLGATITAYDIQQRLNK